MCKSPLHPNNKQKTKQPEKIKNSSWIHKRGENRQNHYHQDQRNRHTGHHANLTPDSNRHTVQTSTRLENPKL